MGVASLSCGGIGRCSEGTEGCSGSEPDSVGTLSVDTPFTTGRTLGLGGIARPRLGLRPALLLLDPGMGGRSSGAGLDMASGNRDGESPRGGRSGLQTKGLGGGLKVERFLGKRVRLLATPISDIKRTGGVVRSGGKETEVKLMMQLDHAPIRRHNDASRPGR
jgi:hypothetical protein